MKTTKPLAALPLRRGTRAAEGDDDDRQRDRDERLRRIEDDGRDTGETETEKNDRHDRERARKKSKDEGDDDSDRDDEENPEARSARARERGRIAAVLTSAASREFPLLSIHVALQTNLPRTQAIALVCQMGASSAAQVRPENLASQILRAGARARGEAPAAPSRAPTQARGTVATAEMILKAGRRRRGEE
jgi:hypothetical protein